MIVFVLIKRTSKMVNEQELLKKYWEIIKEEVNVKEISSFSSDKPLVKVYKPLGSQLSAKFWKDTGQIIANGKQWNIKELDNGQIEVFSPQGWKWILDSEDYEVVYEGLDDSNIAVDGNMIAKLDLEITPELEREWIARELSRFLNQMRKDADFAVEDKVNMYYSTTSDSLKWIIAEFWEFLKWEALLLKIEEDISEWWFKAEFKSWDDTIIITLVK
jgi:isoleucyl-tRNA synthetase